MTLWPRSLVLAAALAASFSTLGADAIQRYRPADPSTQGDGSRLRVGPSAGKFMELDVTADSGGLLVTWQFHCVPHGCDLRGPSEPPLVQGLAGEPPRRIDSVRQVFPAARPTEDRAAARRRTVSIALRQSLEGELPERIRFQPPALRIAGERHVLPPLELVRQPPVGRISEYVPAGAATLPRMDALLDFGGRSTPASTSGALAAFVPAVRPWHAAPQGVRVATTFLGRADAAPPFWDRPFVAGELRVLVPANVAFEVEGVAPENLIAVEAGAAEHPSRGPAAAGSAASPLYAAWLPGLRPQAVRISFRGLTLDGWLVPETGFEFRRTD